MTEIKSISGRRVWDSRGNPTVEVDVVLADGTLGRAIAPAGASRGSREAIDKRDGGKRFGGKGVSAALKSVNGPIAERDLRGLLRQLRVEHCEADAALGCGRSSSAEPVT